MDSHNVTALGLLFKLIDFINEADFNTCSGAKSFKGKFDVWQNRHHELLHCLEEEQVEQEAQEAERLYADLEETSETGYRHQYD